jgi:hypothetical protein
MTPRLRRLPAAGGALLVVATLLVAPLSPAAADTATPSPSPSAGAAAGSDPTAPPVTFGIGPSTKGKLDRRPNFTLLIVPGKSAKDEFAVVNLTEKPLTLNIYAADAYNGPDGALNLEPAAKAPRDLAKWVKFTTPTGKGFIVLPPRSTRFIPFTVTVPKTAYVGDHLAGVIASTVSAGQAPGDRGADIKLEQRVALRLGVRVAGELTPELTVENVSATYAGTLNPFGKGTAEVTYTVRNTGNVRLGGRQEVKVRGLTGPTVSAGNLPDIPLLLPGGSASVTVPVADIVPLVYLTASVTVQVLAPAGDANPPAPVATGSTTFWAVPWTLLAVFLGILLLGGWLWRRRRMPSTSGTGRRSADASPNRDSDLVGAGTRREKP